jgi:glycerol-3-phosphate O-acyltransferase
MHTSIGIRRPLFRAACRLLYLWIRTSVLPRDPAQLALAPSMPVIYVLDRRFFSDLLILAHETEAAGLPPAMRPVTPGNADPSDAYFSLSQRLPRADRTMRDNAGLLRRLAATTCHDPAFDAQIVPVSILWGRAPDKEHSVLKLLFADGWSRHGAIRRIITILLHGRHTLVRFGAPMSLRQLAGGCEEEQRAVRRIARILRAHFRRQRAMVIGPDLSHRRTQLEGLLGAPAVRAAIGAEAQRNGGTPPALRKAQAAARKYALEIAADYSYPLVLIGYRFLDWLWTRLYDGVEVSHIDSVTGVAPDHEIIYVPCHRSHIDYLLLSYVVFRHGLMVPHVAAGANLNLPLVGGILRRGGAFFLRRSFKGNRLYAAVFAEYLHMMIRKGYPIEYFVEGGRSRSGRQLTPKAGLLAMTVQGFLRDATASPASRPGRIRPLVFVPVYIGYEKLFEGRTYIGELTGRPKRKESLLDLLRAARELKKHFGKVHVNFGEPIRLTEVLDATQPQWRQTPLADNERPPWYGAAIEQLRQRIAEGINCAAVANPASLASLVLLAAPRHALDAQQCIRQLDGCRRLALAAPYSARAQVTLLDGAAIAAYCEQLRLLRRHPHPLGDVLYLTADDAVLATYTRNNILHLYALPALLASLLTHNTALGRAHLLRLAHTVFPFLRAELFLHWRQEQLDHALDRYLTALRELGWLHQGEYRDTYAAPDINSEEYAHLALLGQTIRPALVRYFITLAMLNRKGPGAVTPDELNALCHLHGQRLSLLEEFNPAEFFDKAVFRIFIDTLTQSGHASVGSDGRIYFDEALRKMSDEARYVLSAEARQAILRVTRSRPVGAQD